MDNGQQFTAKLQGYYSVCNDDTEKLHGTGTLTTSQLVWVTHSVKLEAV